MISHSVTISRLLCLLMITTVVIACSPADSASQQSFQDTSTESLDLGKIFGHVSELMNIEEEAEQVFVRWERPVRYYLQGLENHPELDALFTEQVELMADITGLDIQRHDDVYLEYKDPAHSQLGPDGYSTVVAIFFADDMEKAFQDPKVVKILKGFGDDPKETYLQWKGLNDVRENDAELTYLRHGWDRSGSKVYLAVVDVKYPRDLKNNSDIKHEIIEDVVGFLFDIGLSESQEVTSFFSKNSYELGVKDITAFDKAFLQTYYSDSVKSGMTKRGAALAITDELVKQFVAQ